VLEGTDGMDERQLAGLFVPHLGEAARARISDPAALEAGLTRALAEARAAWPAFAPPPEHLLPFLAARLPEDQDPVSALAELVVADLCLACACLRRDPAAMAAFEAAHFNMVEAALARLRAAPSQIDEVKQILREQLFVGTATTAPTLSTYSGSGSLGGWVRVTAVRAALRVLQRDQKGASPDPDMVEALPAAGNDPELEHLKVRYRAAFKEAFAAAVKRLTQRERNLLRYHHLEGLSVDEIGVLYSVGRSTAQRWVAKAREALLLDTRRELAERLRLGRGEFESIMRLIQSQLHVSLSAILPPEPELEGSQTD
jgi:RNA polymerase sigma-70 factor, ECF subfamily